MKPPCISARQRRSAFSLVEVTLALGIVSFCLISLTGLLGTGLTTVRASRDEAAAGTCLERITHSLESATVATNGTDYRALGAYSNVVWSLGQSPQTYNIAALSSSGRPSSADPKFVARLEITPPAGSMAPGKALIRIAWPAGATWNDSTKSWTNAQGSLSSWQVLLPQ